MARPADRVLIGAARSARFTHERRFRSRRPACRSRLDLLTESSRRGSVNPIAASPLEDETCRSHFTSMRTNAPAACSAKWPAATRTTASSIRPSRASRSSTSTTPGKKVPYTCTQCDEAWCLHACPVEAIVVDAATGAKVVLDDVCVGCKVCTIACPFGTINYVQDTREGAEVRPLRRRPRLRDGLPDRCDHLHRRRLDRARAHASSGRARSAISRRA